MDFSPKWCLEGSDLVLVFRVEVIAIIVLLSIQHKLGMDN